jgi:uncharacterized damage-inducible protein DinB
MADQKSASDLARLTADEFARYFEHMAQRVDAAVQAVAADALWVKPFPFGNSIGHLVLHLTGNLNHYIGAMVGGSGYVRDREREFTQDYHPAVEELLSKFHEAVAMVVQVLHAQDEASFQVKVEHNVPIQTRLGIFLVCASHMNNHIGQMSYLVARLRPGTEQKPVW